MQCLQVIDSTQYFARKKVFVTYVLSVLVFWIHCSTFYNYTGYPAAFDWLIGFVQFVAPWVAIPLFFMISGALFFRDYSSVNYLRKLKSRVHTLMIPYFCWNIIMMLFQFFATMFFSRYFIGRVPFDPSWQGILAGFFHQKYNNPFWFVFALMAFAAAAPIFDRMLKNKYTALVSILLLWILSHLGIGLPEFWFFRRSCIVYYLVGAAAGRFYWDAFTSAAGKGKILAAFFGTLLCFAYEYLIYFGVISTIELLDVGMRILYAVSVWILFDLLIPRIKVRKFEQHSFWVYALHMNVSAVITKLLVILLPKHWTLALPNFLLTTVLTLSAVELSCWFLKRYMPPVYNLLCGSR